MPPIKAQDFNKLSSNWTDKAGNNEGKSILAMRGKTLRSGNTAQSVKAKIKLPSPEPLELILIRNKKA